MSDSKTTTPRRVLGTLPVNTPTTSSKPKNPAFTGLKPYSQSTTPSTPRVGQKRSIDQVDEAALVSAARRGPPVPLEARDNVFKVYEDTQAPVKPIECRSSASMTATSPPRPTEGPLQENGGDASQSSNKDSMSSLIDFDPEEGPAASSQTVPIEASTSRQSTTRLNAEKLRLRLQVALYKVKTNQTNVPLSRLRISPVERVHLSPPQEPSPARETSVPSKIRPSAGFPKLLPAPILVPTAYSARHIYDTRIPTSPTTPGSSSQERPLPELATPALPEQKSSYPPMQLSSPPESQEGDARTSREADPEPNLTSSVIKGKAAKGLLELMNVG